MQYLCMMPIALFEQLLVSAARAPASPRRDEELPFCLAQEQAPANIRDFPWAWPSAFLLPLKEAASLAFSDGIPSIGFLPRREDLMEFQSDGNVRRVRGGWISASSLENCRMRFFTEKDACLLVFRLHPRAFGELLCKPHPWPCRNRIWALPELLGPAGNELLELIQSVHEPAEKLSRFNVWLASRDRHEAGKQGLPARKHARLGDEMLDLAIETIRLSQGRVSLGRLAARLGLNYKWLERSFRKNLGLSPKEFCRQQRFIHAYASLKTAPATELSRLAAEWGYYDQSHFGREFRRFCGRAPLEYLRREGCESTPLPGALETTVPSKPV